MSRTSISSTRHIWTVMIVAAAVRLAYVLAYPQIEPPCRDCGMYDRVAVNIATGRGLVYDGEQAEALGIAGPLITFGPVYPAFLAAVYRIAGYHFAAVRIAQALLGALLVSVMWPVASAAFGPSVARVSTWLVALSPPLITYSGMLLTETLSAVLLMGSVLLLIRAITRRSSAAFVLAGGLAGLLILMRQEMLLVAAGMTGVAAWKVRPALRAVHLAVYLLTIAGLVSAWSVRNYLVFNRPVPLTIKGGEQLWISAKGWDEWRYDEPAYLNLVRGQGPIERDSLLRRDALRLIAEDPGRYLALCVRHLPQLWVSSHTGYVRGLTGSFATYSARGDYGRVAGKLALLGMNVTLLALAGWGAVAVWRDGGLALAGWLMAVPACAVTFTYFFLFATPRYQITALPFVLAFTGVGIARTSLPARARGRANDIA